MYALVDCNNFYVSCERVLTPKLEGKPVIVLSNNDGCAVARSEEAKALGIEMAVPVHLIKPMIDQHGIKMFSSNYTLYGDMSSRVMSILSTYAPQVEQYSVDESFLYFGELKYQNLTELAKRIKKKVKRCTGIPVSIGIAPSKTLAKLANRYAKKINREVEVYALDSKDKMKEVLKWAAIGDVWGIGSQYEKKLNAMGIHTAYDFTLLQEEWVRKNMSVVGQRMLSELKGIPCIPLEEAPPPKKGICTSRSFGILLTDKKDIAKALSTFASRCAYKLRKQNSCTGLIQVFLQINAFKKGNKQLSRQVTIPLQVATNSTPELIHYALKGLDWLFKDGYNYHKTGIMAMDIVPNREVQKSLFDESNRPKENKLMKALDDLNAYMGSEVVKYAVQGSNKKYKLRADSLSQCYTTRIDQVIRIRD